MKLVRNLFMLGCAGMFTLTSCSNDDKSGDGFGRNPVRFTTGIDTRAVDDQWDALDAIGVYMVGNNTTLSDANIVDGASNKKHNTTNGDGVFSNATAGDRIVFPSDGSQVGFIAYYPYTTSITAAYTYPVNVSNQTSSKDIDLMYSREDGFTNASSSVNLQFKHMLSAVRLKITDQEGASLANVSVKFKRLNTTADFSLVDKTFSNAANVADITTVVSNVSGSTAQADAILIPASGLSNVVLSISVPASGKEYNEDFNYDLVSGTRHIYAIELKGDGTVTVTPQGNIDNWTDDDNTGTPIVVDPDAPEQGTKTNPYGVADLDASLVGETKWVEGYVVGVESAGALVTSAPFTVDGNIAIAATAGETNIANTVIVELADADIKASLNLVDNDDLVGKTVKVLGTIATGTAGAFSINGVTDQEGGNTPGSGGNESLDFYETFGPDFEGASGSVNKTWVQFLELDQFDMKAPIVYANTSIDQTRLDFRRTNSYPNPHLWFAANWNAAFNISGIEAGYSNMTLSYDLACNQASAPYEGVMVKCNDVDVTIPTGTLSDTSNTFQTITLTIPDGTTSIEFYATPESNPTGRGYRLDNIKITGSK